MLALNKSDLKDRWALAAGDEQTLAKSATWCGPARRPATGSRRRSAGSAGPRSPRGRPGHDGDRGGIGPGRRVRPDGRGPQAEDERGSLRHRVAAEGGGGPADQPAPTRGCSTGSGARRRCSSWWRTASAGRAGRRARERDGGDQPGRISGRGGGLLPWPRRGPGARVPGAAGARGAGRPTSGSSPRVAAAGRAWRPRSRWRRWCGPGPTSCTSGTAAPSTSTRAGCRQLTRDQTIGEYMVDAGAWTEEQARKAPTASALVSALGGDELTAGRGTGRPAAGRRAAALHRRPDQARARRADRGSARAGRPTRSRRAASWWPMRSRAAEATTSRWLWRACKGEPAGDDRVKAAATFGSSPGG